MKAGALLMSGAALGAAAGYVTTASGAGTAAPASAKTRSAHVAGAQARLRRAVSVTAVVADGHGKFATVSIERGTLVSALGSTVVIREGTPRATYKTATLSLPSNTVIRLSRQPSTLSALSAGDRIVVVQGPRRTLVSARPPAKSNTSTPSTSGTSEAPTS